MKYALLLYSEESANPEFMDDAARKSFQQDFAEFNRSLGEKQAFVGARRLRAADTATTVRLKDGETLVTDGPFAETKEVLAGFFLIDCADLDEALDWAKRIPSARIGAVEVRPIWENY